MAGCCCCGVAFRPVTDLILTFIFSVIFGISGLITLIVDIFRKGPKRVLCGRTRNVRPEALKNSEFGTHGFARLPNSRMKLHYVVNGPTDKPLILFIHGFPECWYSWRFQLREFGKDHRVVAFDMRGYGDSDKPTAISDYNLDVLTDDLDQLITELGYDKCILVGHDWGGAVAWSYAARYPQRVNRLIILNCPHGVAFRAHLKSSVTQLLMSWYMFLFQVPFLPELVIMADDYGMFEAAFCGKPLGAKRGTFTAEDMEVFKYTFARYRDCVGPVNIYRSAFRYASPAVEQAQRRKIAVPTLIIWGTKDGALDKKLAELSAKHVERCSIQYVEGASHWVQQEEPEQVNQFIRQFLKQEF